MLLYLFCSLHVSRVVIGLCLSCSFGLVVVVAAAASAAAGVDVMLSLQVLQI